jgi:hypothetical protein
MNEHQPSHLRQRFQYVDKLLADAEYIMMSESSSPFREYSQDTNLELADEAGIQADLAMLESWRVQCGP